MLEYLQKLMVIVLEDMVIRADLLTIMLLIGYHLRPEYKMLQIMEIWQQQKYIQQVLHLKLMVILWED